MKFKRGLKYLFFLLLIVSLGLLYGFSLGRNLRKKVTEIKIEFVGENNNFLTNSMVDKLLIQSGQIVTNLEKSVIDLYGLENQVNQNPYVEQSSVFMHINGTIKTIVKQRTPIARILSEDDSYYIDKQGVKIPLSPVYSARVLLISGVEKEENLKEILALVTTILEDDFLNKEIVDIHKTNNNGYQFSVRSGNYKIDFGKLINIDIKFKKLKAFYNKAFLDKTIHEYKTINVTFHNQVVCTK
jgi:cell division protein FtsQ